MCDRGLLSPPNTEGSTNKEKYAHTQNTDIHAYTLAQTVRPKNYPSEAPFNSSTLGQGEKTVFIGAHC
jgi:hypothetical protein